MLRFGDGRLAAEMVGAKSASKIVKTPVFDSLETVFSYENVFSLKKGGHLLRISYPSKYDPSV